MLVALIPAILPVMVTRSVYVPGRISNTTGPATPFDNAAAASAGVANVGFNPPTVYVPFKGAYIVVFKVSLVLSKSNDAFGPSVNIDILLIAPKVI